MLPASNTDSMKLIKQLLTFQTFLTLMSCNGQTKTVLLSDLKFQSIFGYNSKDSSQVYCLLGTGFFRAPSSKNSDSLMENWINNHPNAQVIPISTLDEPKSKMTYCWLVDKSDTINNYLIKNGCFPGGTMMRPQTYDEMSNKMKSVYGKDNSKIIVHIDKKSYDTFIEQIKVAEAYAETNKLGIWNKKNDDE